MRLWSVAGGLLADDRDLLLVANRRRDGSVDWSTPGGVVDEGETSVGALSREVREETGLVVVEWARLCWTTEVDFVDLEMRLTAEVHLAAGFEGELMVDDPDGIVIAAEFVSPSIAAVHLESSLPWVAEPTLEWLERPWAQPRQFSYRATGRDIRALETERLDP